MLIRKIDEILEKNFFELVECREIKALDLIFYKKDGINVFLGKQNYPKLRYEDIEGLAFKLRKCLIDLNINIYNSYLLYCIKEDGISQEEGILLERSSKYLRKYILRYFEDIERIFFLNQILWSSKYNLRNSPEVPEDIKKIISYMEFEDEMVELNNNKIDIVVEKIIKNLGGNDED